MRGSNSSRCPVAEIAALVSRQVDSSAVAATPTEGSLYTLRWEDVPAGTLAEHTTVTDLDDLVGEPITNEVLREATDRIMSAITALVEDLRGEQAPAVRFDPRQSGVTEIGNPRNKKRRDQG